MAVAKPTTPKTVGPQQTFLEHLYELRRRFFIVALIMVAGCLLGYTFHDQVIHVLLRPLDGEKLVYLTPGGGFDFIFKVSLYVGIALAIPVVIYQLYRYLGPLMSRPQTRRFTVFVIFLSCLLATSGTLFGFFVALPAALNFLTSFAGDYIQANLTASSYLGFVMAYLLGLAALFQLPLILLFVNAINGPLKLSKLLASEQYVLLGSFILAAIITPTPDIINQSIVAGPVIVVYQLGIGLVLFQNRTHKRKLAPEEKIAFVMPESRPRSIVPKAPVVAKPQPIRSQPGSPTFAPIAIHNSPKRVKSLQMDITSHAATATRTARPVLRPPARPIAAPKQRSAPQIRARQAIDGIFIGP